MSVWTHVAGCIRFDDLRHPGVPSMKQRYVEALGRTFVYGDSMGEDKCTVPCGSEGSLQWSMKENPCTGSMAAYAVSIWGDLRDFDDLDAIQDWFTRCVEGDGFLVRQAVLVSKVEFGRTRILAANADCHVIEAFDGESLGV